MLEDDNTANEDQAALQFPEAPETGKTAAEILERYKKGLAAQNHEARQYWLNHSYVLGEQWLWWNNVTRSIDTLPRDPDRVQVTVNRMWPASRTLIAKLTSRKLVFDVPPTGADDATIRAARTSESICNSLRREHNWEDLREDVSWAAWKGGTGALCVEWDSTLGEPLGVRGDGRVYSTGDTVETALSIVDFVIEPGARDMRTAAWWIKHVCLPPEQVQDMFGLEQKPKADASAGMTPYQSKLLAQHVGSGTQVPDLTRVLTYYERPSNGNPAGQMAILVSEKIVESAPWPFPFQDKLNIVPVRETHLEGRWYGATVLTMARPVQTALNQSWSSIIEHMKLAGNARLQVPEAATDMIESLTDLPAEIIIVPEGSEGAAYLSPPQMPAWWIQQPMVLNEQMDDILAVHDVSRGKAPVNIESGLGLSVLIEQDSTPIGRMVNELARAFGDLAQMVLEIYQENVIETRQAVVKTPGQPAETATWTGGDLLGQTGVEVPVDAIMPRSRAQQAEMAKQALQMGLIGTLEEFVKVADLPDQRDLLEALSPDVAKARRENHMLALGQATPPAVFDNHKIHINEHLVFMKSPRWDTLAPAAQEYFILHNQAHAVLDAEAMGRQVAKGMTNPFLAAAADANGGPVLPMEALPGFGGAPAAPAPGTAPEGEPAAGGGKVPGAQNPDEFAKGKKIGNGVAAAKDARNNFQPSTRSLTTH